MCSIFLRFPFAMGTLCLSTEFRGMEYSILRHLISSFLRTEDFLMYYNGKEMAVGQFVPPNSTVLVSLTLPGGKGGFGSMLRAIGAQIEKTTNREACRDLSGRRLRDINEEQRLKKWIAKKAEREAERIRRRKERIERLKSTAKHNFVDFEYEKAISSLPERIDDALSEGMQKAKKRPLDPIEASASTSKKKSLWLDEDMSSTSDSDSDAGKNSSDSLPGTSVGNESEDSIPKEFRSEACATISSQDSCSSFRSDEELTTASKDQGINEEKDDSSQDKTSSVEMHEETSSELEILQQPVETKIICEGEKKIDEDGPKTSKEQIQNEKKINSGEKIQDDKCENTKEQIQDDKSKNTEIDAPIDLMNFNNVSELEALGLDRLKSALMVCGLKCGGTVTDRAQRLWAIRGLKPNEYPKNLLAKQKK